MPPNDKNTENLTKDDLFFLMEGYKNAVELSTTLLNSQNEIMAILKSILNNQTEIIKKNEKNVEVSYSISADQLNKIEALATRIDSISIKLDSTCKEITNKVDDDKSCTMDEIKDFKESYNSSTTRINLTIATAIIGMISIIGSIITFSYSISSKYNEIISLLTKIANKLGVMY